MIRQLPDFPRKTREISVIYAFDLEAMEPVSSKCFPRNMPDFTGIFEGAEGITSRKEKCAGKDGTYSLEALRERQPASGTIVLECDLDLSPSDVYKAYSKRWEIEIVMRYYKSACQSDETRVHDDYSVTGSEFCDFLSSVMTFRMLSAFDKAGLQGRMTYKKVMAVLTRANEITIGLCVSVPPVNRLYSPTIGKVSNEN